MALRHGKNAKIYIAGYDLSGLTNSIKPSMGRDMAKYAVMDGTGAQHVHPGLASDKASIQGLIDDDSHTVFDALRLAATGYQVMLLLGTALGDPAYCANEVRLGGYQKNSVVTDINRFAADVETHNYPFDECLLLSPKAAKTSDGSGTALNNTADSDYGLVAYLQVFAVGAGKTVTVTIDHSDDGNSWTAGLISFTGATGITTERKTAAGTIKQYLRATWAFSGGAPYTATFALCVKRNTV